MRQVTLNTKHILDLIKDSFDDLRMVGAVPDIIYQRKTAQARMLEALNTADIDTCGHLDLEITAIAYVPSGISEFAMNVQEKYAYQMVEGLAESTEVDELSLSVLLNNRRWTNFGDTRSSYLYAYHSAPIGGARPVKRFRIVSESIFNNENLRYDLAWDEGYAVIEPASGRCRLSEPTSGNTFFTWTATLLPFKVDMEYLKEQYGVTELYKYYNIATPVWAKDLLVAKAMIDLLPVTVAVRKDYMYSEQSALASALRNMPTQTSTFRAESYIGPE